jgi:hypothetical protein
MTIAPSSRSPDRVPPNGTLREWANAKSPDRGAPGKLFPIPDHDGNAASLRSRATLPYTSNQTAVSETMEPETVKLTIRLPKPDVAFAKSYAAQHGLTVTEVIDRYLRRMRTLARQSPSPELEAIAGLVPAQADARDEHRRHLHDKYSR